MAQWHLDELRAAFEHRGWRIADELPGDDRGVSASWRFVRSGSPPEIIVDFEGVDDLKTLPITESYACRLRDTLHSLYFRRRGTNDVAARERWQRELASFVAGVENHAT